MLIAKWSIPKNPSDLMVGSVLERCATNDGAVKDAEIHKSPTIIITVAMTMFSYHMSKITVLLELTFAFRLSITITTSPIILHYCNAA